MHPTHIAVVLVRPRLSTNVGAICRLVKNFGLGELRLVEARDLDEAQVRRVAYGSVEIWDQRREFETLQTAIADCHWVVGTTRRPGRFRRRGYDAHALGQALADRSEGERAALVFGTEDAGLTEADLRFCHSLAEIPQHSEQPSLNLSHAVAVFAYEIHRRLQGPTPDSRLRPDYRRAATQEERDVLIGRMESLLERTGYPEERRRRFGRALRHFFQRPFIEEPDIRVFHQWMDHWEQVEDGGK